MKNIKLFNLKIKNNIKKKIVKSIENNINNSDFVRGKISKFLKKELKKKQSLNIVFPVIQEQTHYS